MNSFEMTEKVENWKNCQNWDKAEVALYARSCRKFYVVLLILIAAVFLQRKGKKCGKENDELLKIIFGRASTPLLSRLQLAVTFNVALHVFGQLLQRKTQM